MSPPPSVKYAVTPDGSVAYQVFGDAPDRIVLVPDWHNPIEMLWEDPRAEQFFTQLGSFSRVIFFDKRGTGVSDPMPSDSELAIGPTIPVSRTIEDLIGGSGIGLAARGLHRLKGVGEPWELYAVAATKGE